MRSWKELVNDDVETIDALLSDQHIHFDIWHDEDEAKEHLFVYLEWADGYQRLIFTGSWQRCYEYLHGYRDGVVQAFDGMNHA